MVMDFTRRTSCNLEAVLGVIEARPIEHALPSRQAKLDKARVDGFPAFRIHDIAAGHTAAATLTEAQPIRSEFAIFLDEVDVPTRGKYVAPVFVLDLVGLDLERRVAQLRSKLSARSVRKT